MRTEKRFEVTNEAFGETSDTDTGDVLPLNAVCNTLERLLVYSEHPEGPK